MDIDTYKKVHHPKHYNVGDIEVIDFIEDQGLGFHLGNAIKYITRAQHKKDKVEDLKKAIWYLERELGEHKDSLYQTRKSVLLGIEMEDTVK